YLQILRKAPNGQHLGVGKYLHHLQSQLSLLEGFCLTGTRSCCLQEVPTESSCPIERDHSRMRCSFWSLERQMTDLPIPPGCFLSLCMQVQTYGPTALLSY